MVITRHKTSQQGNEEMAATSDSVSDVNTLYESLPEEYKTVVKVITEMISTRMNDQLSDLKKEQKVKDKQIDDMQNNITMLTSRVEELEQHLDNVEQYERRDTVILAGSALPPETPQENTTNIVKQVIKDQLKINLHDSDISVTHRLGQKRQQQHNRPIIVKLVNRSLKRDLVGACIQLRPELYVNESLTPKRLGLLKQILAIRKTHKQKFKQCYTQDGKIIIKLTHSTTKHTISDEKQLLSFLQKYPEMMDTYQQQNAALP